MRNLPISQESSWPQPAPPGCAWRRTLPAALGWRGSGRLSTAELEAAPEAGSGPAAQAAILAAEPPRRSRLRVEQKPCESTAAEKPSFRGPAGSGWPHGRTPDTRELCGIFTAELRIAGEFCGAAPRNSGEVPNSAGLSGHRQAGEGPHRQRKASLHLHPHRGPSAEGFRTNRKRLKHRYLARETKP